MSIVSFCSSGWFIDHKAFIESVFHNVIDNNDLQTCACYKCPEEMFNIKCQFMMDSQYNAKYLAEQHRLANNYKEYKPTVNASCVTEAKKKRKRKLSLNDGEMASIKFHEKIVKILQKALTQLVSLGSEKGAVLSKDSTFLPDDNNVGARAFAKMEGPVESLAELSNEAIDYVTNTSPKHLMVNDVKLSESPVNTLIYCDSEDPCVKNILGNDYLIPPNCSFLLSDISHVKQLVHAHHRYDIVVIDPPWQNKSIKRKKKYTSMEDASMLHLPMEQLLADDCLVIIWVTNKQKQHRFVFDELLPKWKLSYKTYWYWLKITKYGDPVVPLDSGMKKPYECMILATRGQTIQLPEDQVVVSIPCATHSRKPPLHDILKSTLAPDKDINKLHCLELFARNLMPGWTSWGNEVIKHQHESFFEKNLNS